MNVPDSAIIGACASIGAAVAAAMKLMWDALKRDHDAQRENLKEVRAENTELRGRIEVQERRSDDCERDRRDLHAQQNQLKAGVAAALACTQPGCAVRQRIAQAFSLHESVRPVSEE